MRRIVLPFVLCGAFLSMGLTDAISQQPQVTLVALEVTQAIQKIDSEDPWNNASNSVPLIARRQTYVRAYFDLKEPKSGPVSFRGEIRGRLDGKPFTAPKQQSDNEVTVMSNEKGLITKRLHLSKSLNFKLPEAWVRNAGELTLSVDVQGVTCVDCSNIGKSLKRRLHKPSPLRVWIVLMVEVDDTTGAVVHMPNRTDAELVRSWLKRAYPIPNLGAEADKYLELGEHRVKYSFSSCDQVNGALAAYRKDVLPPEMLGKTRLVGLFADDDRQLSGCMSGSLKSGAHRVDVPVAVPSGANSWPNAGLRTAGSYADWYTGHELAHTFGFHHLHHCNELKAPEPPDYDRDDYSYEGGISDAQGSYVGFDVGPLGALIGGKHQVLEPKPLPGSDWYDVRTYCERLWVSFCVYKSIRDALELENSNSFAPLPTNPCIQRGVSEHPEAALVPTTADSGVPSVSVKDGNFLVVVFRVNLKTKQVLSSSTAGVKRAEVFPPAEQDEAILRLVGDDGQMVEKRSAIRRTINEGAKEQDETGLIYDSIELPPGKTFKVLKLFLGGKEPAIEIPLSKDPPEVVFQPSASLVHFAGYRAGTFTVEWRAEDSDTDIAALTYTVEISFDEGPWRTLATGWPDQTMFIGKREIGALAGKTLEEVRDIRFKVTASDGFNSSQEKISKSFRVEEIFSY